MSPQQHLFIRQSKWWSGFAYDILDERHTPIGSLQWPKRPKGFDDDDFKLDLRGQTYSITWDVLNYEIAQNLRYKLAINQTLLGHIDVLYQSGIRRPVLHMSRGHDLEVRHAGSGFEVLQDETQVGSITQPGFITLKRELALQLPGWLDESDAVFLGTVALAVML